MKRTLLFLLPLAVACSSASSSDDSKPEPGATDPPPAASIELTADGHLRLPRQAAEGPWLLRAVFLREGATNVDPLRSRVVRFRDDGGGRWTLRDATDAADVNAAPPPDAPALGSFEAKADGDALDFDLARGLDRIVTEFGLYEPWNETEAFTLDVREPKVTAARRDGDTAWLRREVTVDYPGAGPAKLRLDQALSPYRPAAGFTPRPNNEAQGYYVNAPVAPAASKGGGGEKVAYAHRHHDAAPVVFHYVAETPPERVADIRTAVAYWNDVFARAGAALRLEAAPLEAGLDPILSNRHVIVYQAEPDAGGRGVNQTDPRTGRIVQATVNVNGVFAIQGADVAEARWARARLDEGAPATPLPEPALARAISDYYVNTFAHEIGHCLGMRHNFAGNLGSPADAETWFSSFDDYLRGDLPEGVVVTSSVMEYVETPFAILVGAHMRLERGPLAYDLEAARSMYGDGEARLGLACEAEVSPVYADCAEFDLGPDPIEGAYRQWEDAVADQAFRVARALDDGAAPEDPSVVALIVANPLVNLARHFEREANFLSVLSRQPFGAAEPSEAELAAYRAEVLAEQKKGFARIEGPRAAFARGLLEKGRAEAADVDAFARDFEALVGDYLEKLGAPAEAPPQFTEAFRTGLAEALAPVAERPLACLTCDP